MYNRLKYHRSATGHHVENVFGDTVLEVAASILDVTQVPRNRLSFLKRYQPSLYVCLIDSGGLVVGACISDLSPEDL